MSVTTIGFELDSDVVNDAESLFANYGLTVTDAIRVFLHQSLIDGGFPFEMAMKQPNARTVAAMLEARQITRNSNARCFSSIAELKADLMSDDKDDDYYWNARRFI